MKQYYDILGVQSGATQEEIKKAFKEKALKMHPDHGGSKEDFQRLNEAYSILSGKQQPKHTQPDPNFGGFNPFDFGFDFNHIRDIFNQANKSNPQGSARRQYQKPPDNERDLKISFDLSIEDIKNGKEFKINYNQSTPCKKCNGIGGTKKERCSQCNGHGHIKHEQRQANFCFSSTTTCPSCQGTGETIDNICKECKGNGFKIFEKELTFIVKEK